MNKRIILDEIFAHVTRRYHSLLHTLARAAREDVPWSEIDLAVRDLNAAADVMRETVRGPLSGKTRRTPL
jgi:hypothetical protein